MNKPKRRFELEIKISGDNWPDVEQKVQEAVTIVLKHAHNCTSFGVGYSSSYSIQLTESPEMTGERYRKELADHVDVLNAEVKQ